jgi:methionyl-tRNA synthetase
MADGTLDLPFRVDGLQFLNYEGDKISKSKRWGVFCEKLPEAGIDVDVWRAYLTFLIPETADTEFRWDDFEARVKSDLIGKLGNFFNRTLSLVKTRLGEPLVRPADAEMTEADRALLAALAARHAEIDRLLAAGELRAAFGELFALATVGNQYFDAQAPWKLVKTDKPRAARVLWLCASVAASLAVLMAPYTPGAADRAWSQLALAGTVRDPGRWQAAAAPMLPSPHAPGDPKPIFAQLPPEEVARVKAIVTDPPDLRSVLGMGPKA